MLIGVGSKKSYDADLNFGTHNGIFHSDEILGIAILLIAYMNSKVFVVRTRDLKILGELDRVIDVGGGMFDHHMAGFSKCRSTGEIFASAGLVWQAYGTEAIVSVLGELGLYLDYSEIVSIQEELDKEFIIPVDLEDNGVKVSTHSFSFIPSFLPSWMGTPDYDEAFGRALTVVSAILKEFIKEKIIQRVTKKELEKRFEENLSDGILEIPAQTMPWLEDVLSYNLTHGNAIKFVIFPYPNGGWAAQCVPPSAEDKFSQLVPFPKKWAGGNEKTLPAISGIKDALFCHNGRFFARAEARESVIRMCMIAMNL